MHSTIALLYSSKRTVNERENKRERERDNPHPYLLILTSHHAYDIYTSTSMLVCNNNLNCQHFPPNCADVLNVGSVPRAGSSPVSCKFNQ